GRIGQAWNSLLNEGRSFFDINNYQDRRKQFDALANGLATEAMNSARGAGPGSQQEIAHWRDILANPDASENEMRGAITGLMGYMEGAMDSMAEKRSQGRGAKTYTGLDLLSPKAREGYEKMRAGGVGTAAPAQAPAQASRGAPEAGSVVPGVNTGMPASDGEIPSTRGRSFQEYYDSLPAGAQYTHPTTGKRKTKLQRTAPPPRLEM